MIAVFPEFEPMPRRRSYFALLARHGLTVWNCSTPLVVYGIDAVGQLRALG
jgi:hypothetical protein